jgi:4-amino-4-deoxy-L-arabinose transferase-like glycosyltransferase
MLTKLTFWYKANKIFVWIFVLAFFLIFYQITMMDILHDDAHFITRSVGLADYMFAGDKQPTPLILFEKFPWWAHFSFHDQPILIFLIQHFFLSLKTSTLFAKLPSAFLSLGTLILVYLWTKKLFSKKTALLAALLLTLNTYFLWISKLTYLEAGVMFFAVLAFYLLELFIEDEKKWWLFGIFFGLSLLTKYIAFFVIPAIFVYIIIKKPSLLKNKKLYFALLLALLAASPIIIYNWGFYSATGHFDMQFSKVFHQSNPWGIENEYVSFNLKSYFIQIYRSGKIIGNALSWPYFFIFLFSLIYYPIANWRSKNFLPFLGFILAILLIAELSPQIRYLACTNAFLAIITAFSLHHLFSKFSSKKIFRFAGYGFFSVFIIYLAFFTFNSHLLAKPLNGPTGLVASTTPTKNYGLSQLDEYLDNLLKDKQVAIHLDVLANLKNKKNSLKKYLPAVEIYDPKREQFNAIIVYDRNINWFSRVWLFERRVFYDNLPCIPDYEFIRLSQEGQAIKEFYFIKATKNTMLDQAEYITPYSAGLEESFLKAKIAPIATINRRDGEPAFKIYYYKDTSN